MYKQVNARKYCKAITILFILWPLVLMGIYWPVAAEIRRSVYGMSEPVSASFNWKAMRVKSTVWPLVLMEPCWLAVEIRRCGCGILIPARNSWYCNGTARGCAQSLLAPMGRLLLAAVMT